jgi:SAM-dependent methyltransferase
MATWVSERTGQFAYFDHQLGYPDWTGKRVLDFGGNVGNLLLDPNCRIDPSDYWSIDISRDAITEGRRRHPDAHFVFYDRYHYEYNPTGTAGLPIPDPGVRFDFIVAFSVVTHNGKAETLELVDRLMALLTGDGRLAFTFLDPLWAPPADRSPRSRNSDVDATIAALRAANPDLDAGLVPRAERAALDAASAGCSNLRWRLEQLHVVKPETDVAGLLAQAEHATLTWAALVDGDVLVLDPDDDGLPRDTPQEAVTHRQWGYVNFCTAGYMSRLFPYARIRPPTHDRQHCAIIDARKGTGR